MGFRHLTLIYHNAKYVLAQYGQFDGYPEFQGPTIHKFLSMPGKIADLKSNLHLLQVGTPDELDAIWEECYQADIELVRRNPYNFSLGTKDLAVNRRYPGISDSMGAKILNHIADVKDNKPIIIHEIKQSLEFAMDPYCKFIYHIDLDANKLNVYGHRWRFDTDAAQNRFLSLQQRNLSEQEILTNAASPFLVEFDIEKLPGEEEFMSQIDEALDKMNGKEDNDKGDES